MIRMHIVRKRGYFPYFFFLIWPFNLIQYFNFIFVFFDITLNFIFENNLQVGLKKKSFILLLQCIHRSPCAPIAFYVCVRSPFIHRVLCSLTIHSLCALCSLTVNSPYALFLFTVHSPCPLCSLTVH